jgi:hypothetical protein
MAKYMFLLIGDPAQWDAMTAEQGKAHDAAHAAFAAAAALKMAGGGQLGSAVIATTLRSDGTGGVLMTEGPFTETKEQIGGFYLLEVSSLDEAVTMASMLPEVQASHSGVEIRPVLDLGFGLPPRRFW